jgi:hypothetical protein
LEYYQREKQNKGMPGHIQEQVEKEYSGNRIRKTGKKKTRHEVIMAGKLTHYQSK